jgi:hypothetical protein
MYFLSQQKFAGNEIQMRPRYFLSQRRFAANEIEMRPRYLLSQRRFAAKKNEMRTKTKGVCRRDREQKVARLLQCLAKSHMHKNHKTKTESID